jgi:hypothetical protein
MEPFVKTTQTSALTMLIAGLLASVAIGSAPASAASTEPNEDADLNARIAHMKAKARSRAAKAGEQAGSADQLDQSKTCGSVDIGNITTPASRGRQPREVTVIVTGDVINSADCR